MHSIQKTVVSLVVIWGVSQGLLVTGVQAQSGSLEPPGTAVDNSGNPASTTQTQPSWDQTLPASERFVLVMGGAAVMDKETGLVWEQSPDAIRHGWDDKFSTPVDARLHCARLGTGGRMGWRLPSLMELTSLVVPGNPAGSPDLPAGHPFSNVQSSGFWSATTNVDFPSDAWVVYFGNGSEGTLSKTAFASFVWCVRGGGPLSAY